MLTTATKKPVRKSAPAKSTKTKKTLPSWIGSARGQITIKPGVDLTKPTLAPGKYL